MTIRERIDRNAAAQRAARQEWLEKTYRHGYKAPRERSMAWDAIQVISALVGSLLVLVLALQWMLS